MIYEEDDHLRNSPFSYGRRVYRYAGEDEGASRGIYSGGNRSHQEAAAVQMELRKLLVRSAIFGGSYRGGKERLREIREVGKYRSFG